jgi:hypothetical protein
MPERLRRAALPLLLCLAAAGATALLTHDAEDAYRAEAALPFEPVIGADALRGLLRLGEGGQRLRYEKEAPDQPAGTRALDAALARTLRAEPELDGADLRDSVRIIDSLLSFLQRRRRALLLRVEQPDAARAEVAARTLGAEYVAERRRWLRSALGPVEERLVAEAASAPSERSAELRDGALLTRRLAEGGLAPPSGEVEVSRLASDPARDVLVAALVGLLLGLAIPRLRGRPCVSSS